MAGPFQHKWYNSKYIALTLPFLCIVIVYFVVHFCLFDLFVVVVLGGFFGGGMFFSSFDLG